MLLQCQTAIRNLPLHRTSPPSSPPTTPDLPHPGCRGTPMLLATHAMMHDPAVWPQPEAFLPQRFLPGQGQGLLPRGAGQGAGGGSGEAGPGSAWAPFGLGPRMCVGNKFATMVREQAGRNDCLP